MNQRIALISLVGLVSFSFGCPETTNLDTGFSGRASIPPSQHARLITPPGGTSGWGSLFDADGGRFQVIYRASDVKSSGPIVSYALYLLSDEAADTTCDDVSVHMGHTSVVDIASASTTFVDNVNQGKGSFVQVRAPAPLVIPAGSAGDAFSIPLDAAFNYNAADTLIVEIVSGPCTNQVSQIGNAPSGYQALLYGNLPTDTTGIRYTGQAKTRLGFRGGDAEQSYGGASSNSWPISTSTPRAQFLYLADEIDGQGDIVGFGFQLNVTSPGGMYTATIRMGHSTLTSLTFGGTWDDNFDVDGSVLVADEIEFDVPPGILAGEWYWLPLPDGQFAYDGTSNLVVDIATSAATASITSRVTVIAGSNRRAYNSDHAAAGPNGADTTMNHGKLRFAGGTVDVIGTGNGSIVIPFYATTDYIMQYLYLSSELGTKGRIDRIACRTTTQTIADETYPNFEVVLGHYSSADTTLGDTFAANLADAVTVFSGEMVVPAGLAVGDWIEVPLTTPFDYNGVDHLVVQFAIDPGSTNLGCRYSSTAPRYDGRSVYTSGRTSLTDPTPNTLLADLKLWLHP